ncbi:hypothetical protein Droror1_Dr00010709 [Drosera rotundifolia]
MGILMAARDVGVALISSCCFDWCRNRRFTKPITDAALPRLNLSCRISIATTRGLRINVIHHSSNQSTTISTSTPAKTKKTPLFNHHTSLNPTQIRLQTQQPPSTAAFPALATLPVGSQPQQRRWPEKKASKERRGDEGGEQRWHVCGAMKAGGVVKVDRGGREGSGELCRNEEFGVMFGKVNKGSIVLILFNCLSVLRLLVMD